MSITMKVRDVMTHHVEIVDPEASIKDAAQIMDDCDVGALPVCDNDRLVGIITDRDIIVRAISAGLDPNHARVADSMTSPILYCFEEQDVEDARSLMQEKKVRRLPVMDQKKRLVGIVSASDVIAGRSMMEQNEEMGKKAA